MSSPSRRRSAGSLVAALFGVDHVIGGAAIALLMSGLAVVLLSGDLIHLRRLRVLRVAWLAAVVAPALAVIATIVVQPWFASTEVATSIPASAIGRFFGENFERRTNRPLQAVAGDPLLAALVALGPSRPHLLLDAASRAHAVDDVGEVQRTRRRRGLARVRHRGHAPRRHRQAVSGHRSGIPRAFERLVNGRLPLLRIGWAIVRPKAP